MNIDHNLTIQCDNQQTIRLLTSNTPRLITKLKHIDVHNHWLKQEIQAGKLLIDWIPTGDMRADGLTKPLPRQKHQKFVQDLGLKDISEQLPTWGGVSDSGNNS